MTNNKKRLDHIVICNLIKKETKVLDLGCGEGDLLNLLVQDKNVKAQGIELNEEYIYKCVERGLNVFHGDIETGLGWYPDKSFDYVILNQSMQEVKNVDFVIHEALRVGRKLIVGFPNFAFIKARIDMFIFGKAPITKSLPYRWYDTPNLHFLSIRDFRDYCKDKNIKILKKIYLGKNKYVKVFPNLFAVNAIFLLTLE